MAQNKKTQTVPPVLRTAGEILLMAVLSVGLLFGAQHLTTSYVVQEPMQTELLYITAYRSRTECVTWHPRSMVDRQTARSIVDYMAGCRTQPGFRRADRVMADRPQMELHFRTGDSYRVVCLGNWEKEGRESGWVADQDQSGFAKRLPDAARLIEYIEGQLSGSLALPVAS